MRRKEEMKVRGKVGLGGRRVGFSSFISSSSIAPRTGTLRWTFASRRASLPKRLAGVVGFPRWLGMKSVSPTCGCLRGEKPEWLTQRRMTSYVEVKSCCVVAARRTSLPVVSR